MACLSSLSFCMSCSLLSFLLTRGEKKRKVVKARKTGGEPETDRVCSTQQVIILSIFHHDKSCRDVDTRRDSTNVWLDKYIDERAECTKKNGMSGWLKEL